MRDVITRPSAPSTARVGVLLGAVGLFLFNLVFGPIAIGIGVAALRRGTRPGRDRATAVASIALGAADLAVLLVLTALSLSRGALTWHLG